MAKLLHHEPQAAIADLGIQNPPDGIAFRRPDMKQALVVFAGDRVLRVGKVKDPGTVFENHGVAGSAQKFLQRAAERFWSHGSIFPALPRTVCDV
jgi:hypothetical protein